MTVPSDNLHSRVAKLEERLDIVEVYQLVFATGLRLARWLTPVAVSLMAIVIAILK